MRTIIQKKDSDSLHQNVVRPINENGFKVLKQNTIDKVFIHNKNRNVNTIILRSQILFKRDAAAATVLSYCLLSNH